MSHPRRVPLYALFVLLASISGSAFRQAPSKTQEVSKPESPAAGWKEVDRLLTEQKAAQAQARVDAILATARRRGDEENWTRALVRHAQIESALHGYETAVRFLKEEKRPPGLFSRVVLDLFEAETLVEYAREYSWEIGQRERVEPPGSDPKSWTREQIFEAARRAYTDAWERRAELGLTPDTRLSEYLEKSGYPPGVRSTLQDALTYLFEDLLSDTSGWTPAQSNSAAGLSVSRLLSEEGGASRARLEDPAVHPLEKVVAVLADLETWHAAAGRSEAALEARLERLRRLHASFTQEADRASIRKDLEDRLELGASSASASSRPALRDVPWWSTGMAVLAEFREARDSADNLVEALAAARQGQKAHPDSVGGKKCRSIVERIEAPDFQVAAMTQDGPGRRAIQVTHKNVPALFFRAYAVDLVGRIQSATDYSLLPSGREAKSLLSSGTPIARWSASLPATADYKPHRTFVTPPLEAPGLYVVVVSAREDFGERGNRIVSTNLILTDLALITRLEPSTVEAQTLSGDSGAPVSGAEITLYHFDWKSRHAPVETKTSGADGLVRFDYASGRENAPYFLLARKGKDYALDSSSLSLSKPVEPAETTRSLLYTDRAIYRPGQTISWKVLVFHGRRDVARFETLAHSPVTVSLVDANNQKVDSKTSSTNDFGTASGEFPIPAGRALGSWRIDSSAPGTVSVSVEEYKRPTFEVSWKDIEATARLNRPLTMTGTARYYFGLPVAGGSASWRITRQEELPFGRGWSWMRPSRPAETVAQGTTALKPDGSFVITFTPRADERLGARKEITYRYVATADVMDEGGETRSDTRAFRVGFVGVEATISSESGFFREGAGGTVTIRRTDLNGAPRPGKATWRIVELTQPEKPRLPAELPVNAEPAAERYATPGDRLRPRWDAPPPLEAILRDWRDGKERSRGSASHDAKGETRIAWPPLPAGAYRFHYETEDESGGKFETARDFVVAGKRTPLKVAAALLAESSSVPAGGIARLLALSGFPGQTLFLELYRDGRLIERRRLEGSESSLVEIPVGEKERGGFGVRLALLRDHQFAALTASVFVPWDDRKLAISFSTFRDALRPGSLETWRVTIRTADGKPVEERAAELLAYMYDRSLDAFRSQKPEDPLELYPNRTVVGYERISIGQAYAQWVSSEDYGSVSPPPALTGNRLKFLEGYGLGGPGRRGFLVGGGVGEPLRTVQRAELPAAAAPALQAADRMDQKGAVVAALAAAPPPALRGNFAETAFWRPHLLTDASGSASIEFKVPDSVTSWKVWVQAVTRDLKAGSLEKETKSFKDLMVRPYVPRFLREGDQAQLKVVVNNATSGRMDGRVAIVILDAASNADVSADFGLPPGGGSAPFVADPGGGADVAFSLTTPKRVGTYAFKVTAVSGGASDGELRPVPVLPGRMHLVQSRFVSLKGAAHRTMTFEDMARLDDVTRINEQLVVTVDAQLFYSVLNALPYLVHYPYECTEQTLNRFVPMAIVSALFHDYPAVAKMAGELSRRDTRLETWDAFDPNRKIALEETPWLAEARGERDNGGDLARVLDPRIARAERDAALGKLAKAQTASGGFPWWPGGPPSPYVTIYILHGFANALEFGAEAPRDVVEKAWGYVAGYVREDLDRCMTHDGCWEYATFINYTLSSYSDAWYAKAFTPQDRQRLLAFSFRHWKEHSPYSKSQLALVLKRMGRPADAGLVWSSVMDSAKTDPDLGTFWAPEDRSWLWYNDTIETQALALRTLTEIAPQDPRREGLVQWLFLNKKLNQWKSTKATAEVIASLANYLKSEGALSAREAVSVAVGSETVTFAFEPDRYTGRKNQIVVPGEKLDPKTSSSVAVRKEGPGLAFASATWHFSTDRLPKEERGDFFSVSRRYFKRRSTSSGFVLQPLDSATSLSAGDEIEVQISLRSRHAAEYIHLRDPRAAGLEPENVLSRYKWDLGISWYEETRDSGANFFFESLPAGEYTFKYRLRANMAGVFRVAPAQVESLYAPEFAAYSTGATITVR